MQSGRALMALRGWYFPPTSTIFTIIQTIWRHSRRDRYLEMINNRILISDTLPRHKNVGERPANTLMSNTTTINNTDTAVRSPNHSATKFVHDNIGGD
jgi:hypothetical protein